MIRLYKSVALLILMLLAIVGLGAQVYGAGTDRVVVKIRGGDGYIYVDGGGRLSIETPAESGSVRGSFTLKTTYYKPTRLDMYLTSSIAISAPPTATPSPYTLDLIVDLAYRSLYGKDHTVINGSIETSKGFAKFYLEADSIHSDGYIKFSLNASAEISKSLVPQDIQSALPLLSMMLNEKYVNSLLQQYGITWISFEKFSLSVTDQGTSYVIVLSASGQYDVVGEAVAMGVDPNVYLRCVSMSTNVRSEVGGRLKLGLKELSMYAELGAQGYLEASDIESYAKNVSSCMWAVYTAYLKQIMSVATQPMSTAARTPQALPEVPAPLKELVILPSNTTVELYVGSGSIDIEFNATNLRLGHTTFEGATATKRTATIVYALFDLAKDYGAPIEIDSDVAVDSQEVELVKEELRSFAKGFVPTTQTPIEVTTTPLPTTTMVTQPCFAGTMTIILSTMTKTVYGTATITTTERYTTTATAVATITTATTATVTATVTNTVTNTVTTTTTTTTTTKETIKEVDYATLAGVAIGVLAVGIATGYHLKKK
ncbi:MAG: hypothetical protein QXG81_02995 [Ignisphaera sp.]